MLTRSCVNVTAVKLHVAAARISLAAAAAVYAYIYFFTFLNKFVFSLLPYYANLTKIRVR